MSKKKNKKNNSFYLFFFTRLAVLIVLLLTIVNLNKIFAHKKVLGVQIDTDSVNKQRTYYENLVKENPTYVDGYVELAKISSFVGDKESEKSYLKMAYNINPNNKEVVYLLSQFED